MQSIYVKIRRAVKPSKHTHVFHSMDGKDKKKSKFSLSADKKKDGFWMRNKTVAKNKSA